MSDRLSVARDGDTRSFGEDANSNPIDHRSPSIRAIPFQTKSRDRSSHTSNDDDRPPTHSASVDLPDKSGGFCASDSQNTAMLFAGDDET